MLKELINIFKEILPDSKKDFSKIKLDTKIYKDICQDSCEVFMFAYAIEKKFNVSLPDNLEIKTITVGDIIKIIEKHD